MMRTNRGRILKGRMTLTQPSLEAEAMGKSLRLLFSIAFVLLAGFSA